jgi:hypothetical protein
VTARNIALTDQILAYLAEQAPLPVSTPQVYEALSPPCDGWPHKTCWDRHLGYMAVYSVLQRLHRRGEVEKWPRMEDRRACYWRRLTIREES